MKNANNIYSNPKKNYWKKISVKIIASSNILPVITSSRIQSQEGKANNIRGIIIFHHYFTLLNLTRVFSSLQRWWGKNRLSLFCLAPLYISVKKLICISKFFFFFWKRISKHLNAILIIKLLILLWYCLIKHFGQYII